MTIGADHSLGPWRVIADRVWTGFAREGNNVIVRLPEHLPDQTFQQAWRVASGGDAERFDVHDASAYDGPAAGLVRLLTGTDLADDAPIEECALTLRDADSRSPLVIGVRSHSCDSQRRMLDLLIGWNEQCLHGGDGMRPPQLRVALALGRVADEAESSLGITVIHSWRARLCSAGSVWDSAIASADQRTRRLWQRAVLPELAPFDPLSRAGRSLVADW